MINVGRHVGRQVNSKLNLCEVGSAFDRNSVSTNFRLVLKEPSANDVEGQQSFFRSVGI